MATFSLHLAHLELAHHHARQLVRILRETNTTDDRPTPYQPASLPGDERALRGIPVVGARGIGGHITGTQPGNSLH